MATSSRRPWPELRATRPEAIADYLDLGNVVGATGLADLLHATLVVFEQRDRRLVIRIDAGYSAASTAADLLEAGVGFVHKWGDSRVAEKAAAHLDA